LDCHHLTEKDVGLTTAGAAPAPADALATEHCSPFFSDAGLFILFLMRQPIAVHHILHVLPYLRVNKTVFYKEAAEAVEVTGSRS
jgi:hypothetical protein